MDSAAVVEKYGVPPERYPDLAALVGETSDNLPGIPGVGPKTAAKWITAYGDLDGLLDHADEIKGKAGRTSGRTSTRSASTDSSTRSCSTSSCPSAPTTSRPVPGTARPPTACSTPSSSAPCATGSSRSPRGRGRGRGGVRRRARHRPAGGLGAWLTEHGARPLGVEVAGKAVPGGGDAWGLAVSDDAGRPSRSSSPTWRAPTTRRSPRGSPTRSGPRSCTVRSRPGTSSRRGATTSPASRSTRSSPRTCATPTSAATTWATSSCGTCTVSCARTPRPATTPRARSTSRSTAAASRRDAVRALAVAQLGEVLAGSSRTGGHDAPRRPRAAAVPGARAHGAAWDRGGRHVPARARAALRRPRRDGRVGGVRRHRARGEPGLSQAAPGGAVRPAGDAQDEEDQDGLRPTRQRSRTSSSRRSTRSSSTCSRTATPRGCARRSRAAEVRRRRRPHPRRSSRRSRRRAGSARPTPTCRTSRSAPRQAGASGVRSSSARATRPS